MAVSHHRQSHHVPARQRLHHNTVNHSKTQHINGCITIPSITARPSTSIAASQYRQSQHISAHWQPHNTTVNHSTTQDINGCIKIPSITALPRTSIAVSHFCQSQPDSARQRLHHNTVNHSKTQQVNSTASAPYEDKTQLSRRFRCQILRGFFPRMGLAETARQSVLTECMN
jgi:hypothetical protein